MKTFGNIKTVVENVDVQPSEKYYFTCKVRLLDHKAHDIWYEMQLVVNYFDKTRRSFHSVISRMPQLRRDDGWVKIGGDFKATKHTVAISVEASINDPEIDYEFDEPKMTSIKSNHHWIKHANKRIERLRKNNVTLKINVSRPYDPDKVELKIEQLNHKFGWGTGVIARNILGTSPGDMAYKEFIKEHFQFAVVINAAKWRFMEPLEGRAIFEILDRAMEWLKANGLVVRLHCIAWGKEVKVLPWMKHKSPEDVKQAVTDRMEYMLTRYRGKYYHVDVNNENLHGDWYETKTRDRFFTDWMLRSCHEINPSVRLFCNDYGVCGQGVYAMAYQRQLLGLKERGVPVHCVGLQAHLRDYPDVDRLFKRLNVLAAAKLPIWITELDFRADDIKERGKAYEDLIRIFFSHPRVSGILLWGFWEQNIQFKKAALANGKDHIHLNEAGRRVFNLFEREWRTNLSYSPKRRQENYKFRAFKGDYRLALYYDGELQWNHEFTVDSSKSIKIDVTV